MRTEKQSEKRIAGRNDDGRTYVFSLGNGMLTAVIIVGYLAKWLPELVTVVSIGMIIIYLIAGILLMKALSDLRRSISSDSDSNNTDTDIETEEI